MEPWFFLTAAFVIGASVGSFLNVVIYRLPMNRSVVTPPSYCPHCGTPIRYYDNLPVVGWLLLGGLCRDCGEAISPRYPLIEGFTGLLTMAVVYTFSPGFAALAYAILVWILVAVAFIDLEYQIIPDELSIGGLILGLLVASFLPVTLPGAFFGAFVGGGVFFTMAILYPGGMGGGDIKLMAAIGAFVGWKYALLTIFIGSAVGAVVGVAAIAFMGKGRKSKIPFGPFLSLAGVITLLFGGVLVDWYLSLFIY